MRSRTSGRCSVPVPAPESVFYTIKIKKSNIGFVSGILEGLGNIAFTRTIDEKTGLLCIIVPISQKNNAEKFLKDLKERIKLEIVDIKEGDEKF